MSALKPSKKDEKDLQDFLVKVDSINSIINELTTGDEKEKTEALKKADDFLGKNRTQEPNGFDRSEINKIEDAPPPRDDRQEISAEDFMREIEADTKNRNEKRKTNREKSLTWKEKGNKAFKDEKYFDAVEHYSEAIRLIPDDVIFYSNRAQALIKLEQYEAALKDCETSLKLKKDFVKVYIHKGRALLGLKRYEEAVVSFNHVLKVDKKQKKVIEAYITDVEKQKQLDVEEEKTATLLEGGDETLHEIKSLISSLRKGTPSDIWKGNDVIVKLKGLIVDETQQTLFRTCKGFNIFSEHSGFNRLLKKTSFSPEESKVLVNVVGLLSNVLNDSEENSNTVCSIDYVINSSIECLKMASGLKEEFETIQFFHRISQFETSRKTLLTSSSISELLNQALSILGKGGDLALIAMGTINNLALDSTFVPKFEHKLSTDFIPGVIKMMELLSISHPDVIVTTRFLPVMASSISTVANLFHNKDLRVKQADNDDEQIWKVSHQLLTKYSSEMKDTSILKVVHATLGMLMNLSSQKLVFTADVSERWMTLSMLLMSSSDPVVVERCCGVLNHTLGYNETMIRVCIKKKAYLHFIKILKSDNTHAQRYIMKCLAICSNIAEEVREIISNSKVVAALVKCLDSPDENMIGNTALVFAHCHDRKAVVTQVVDGGLIQKLLRHATNDGLSKTVRHNCAVAIGKYCLVESRCLQQLRDLHGLEILHEVMKEKKLV